MQLLPPEPDEGRGCGAQVPLLYLGRTLIGLTQAPLIVYMPVCRHIDFE